MDAKLSVRLLPPADLTSQDKARMLAPMFKALADETRLTLLLLIADRPRTVRELQDATGLNQTLVSHHLTPLREQGLLKATPRGRSNVYALCCDQLSTPVQLLATLAALTPEGAAACGIDSVPGSEE